ncbi:MAG TPA: phospholipase D-like domain-containing protein [Moraxellaceae bacterium]
MNNTPDKNNTSTPSRNRLPRPGRLVAEQAFSRAAGAPLIAGNSLRLLRDAAGNYPAWLMAIRRAEHCIHFENYIIQDDVIGREFVAALAERARAGVTVRLLYDWMGCYFSNSRRLFRPLIEAGGEVRVFNPARLDSPFGWLTRDHRKSLTVDGRIGYVTGLCVSQRWTGNAARDIAPWRDTGIEVQGPAVADIVAAFSQTWAQCGPPLPVTEIPAPTELEGAGNTTLRVIASSPYTSGLYRLDQMIAAVAQETLWLTDAYFVGTPAYSQALCAASLDGVDVRLLVPSSSDIPLVSPFSRAGYRPLLEAGVRVFEWNGPMIHAKTAVADGRWARVGSSNLNLASWISNYELDIAIEDEAFADEMEAMYLEDLEQSTEIVLGERRKVRPREPRRRRRTPARFRGGSSRVATAMRLGNTVAAAMQQRELGPVEAAITLIFGAVLMALAVLGLYWPRLLAAPIAAVSLWMAICLLMRAWRLRRRSKSFPDPHKE